MQEAELKVIPRDKGHRSTARSLRKKGYVIGNIYGPGLKNEVCAFTDKDIRHAYQNDFNSNIVLKLSSEASELNGKRVIVKKFERDPVTWRIVHADLYEFSSERPLTIFVPLEFMGTPVGVKMGGGILQVLRRSVEVEALPQDLPNKIEVDISALEIGQNVHVGDLKVADKITVLDSADYTVAAVVEPEKEEEAPVTGAAVEGEVVSAEGEAAPAEGEAAPAEGKAAPAGGKAAPAGGKKPAEGKKPAAEKGGDKKS